MSEEQYKNWPAYLRLIEHTWNTTVHRTMQVSPFEAAHGLPARSVADTMVSTGEYFAPDTMDQKGITAMQTTAKALVQIIKQQQAQDAAQTAAEANNKGNVHSITVGDDVSFFIPPTEAEAKRTGRKVKHLAHFKGPAKVIAQPTPTTFAIEYNGSVYGRCLSELRKYNSDELTNLVDPAASNTNVMAKGSYLALTDTDDPDSDVYNRFHLAKVVNIADGQVSLLNYATTNANLKNAKWQVLYQDDDAAYTMVKPRKNAKAKRVIDLVEIDDSSYVRYKGITVTKSGIIAARHRRKLTQLGLQHHVLGRTFP